MIDVILDTSVLLKWLRVGDDQDRPVALYFEQRFRLGQLSVAVPPEPYNPAVRVVSRLAATPRQLRELGMYRHGRGAGHLDVSAPA